MNDKNILDIPIAYQEILEKSKEIGFTMPSDLQIGSLLKTLIASKPNCNVLELGTGIGLSLSWLIEGLDANSSIISIDNDTELVNFAKTFFKTERRLNLICQDGSDWIQSYQGPLFDLIFADAWPGKYSDLDNTLALLKTGGFYIIDDMEEQANWPDGHAEKAANLIDHLEEREDLYLTKMNWSSGIIIATKK